MIRRPHNAITRFGVLLLALFVACAGERSTEPQPVDYRLYVGMSQHAPKWESYVFGVDMASDSIVDSLGYSLRWEVAWVNVSSDGRYMAVHASQPPVIWDLVTHEVLVEFQQFFSTVLFIPEDEIMLGMGRDSTIVFSTPDFRVKRVYHGELAHAIRIPGTTKVLGTYVTEEPTGEGPLTPLSIFDPTTGTVLDTMYLDPLHDGIGAAIKDIDISADGGRFYAIAVDMGGICVTGYDLRQRRVLFRTPHILAGGTGNCRVSPDGREVWATHGANPFLVPWPQYLTIYDAFTGAVLDTISLSQSKLGWPTPVSPYYIQFSPGGRKAYVGCGVPLSGFQPLVVIDTRSREILKVLFDDATRRPGPLAIAPKP